MTMNLNKLKPTINNILLNFDFAQIAMKEKKTNTKVRKYIKRFNINLRRVCHRLHVAIKSATLELWTIDVITAKPWIIIVSNLQV